MRKAWVAFLTIMILTPLAQTAPYYSGVGCNEEGTRCTFGKPSGRVLNWSKKGTIAELGERCEKFLTHIEQRKNEISKTRQVELKYQKFTYNWSRDLDTRGFPKIVCHVELHSELAHVKFEAKKAKSFFWVCDNENSPGVCRHTMRDCENLRDQLLKDKTVLDATIYLGASLLQGQICDVTAVRFK